MTVENWLALGFMLAIGLGATLLILKAVLSAIGWIEMQ